MIETGQLALVRVEEMPSKKKEFTYRVSYPVSVGDGVRVPVPDWAERIIGSDPLSGTVIAESDGRIAYVYAVRDILPESSEAIRNLIRDWRETADALSASAQVYRKLAGELEAVIS